MKKLIFAAIAACYASVAIADDCKGAKTWIENGKIVLEMPKTYDVCGIAVVANGIPTMDLRYNKSRATMYMDLAMQKMGDLQSMDVYAVLAETSVNGTSEEYVETEIKVGEFYRVCGEVVYRSIADETRPEIAISGGELTLGIEDGKVYQLQQADSPSGPWTVYDGVKAKKRFYRVVRVCEEAK